jgi:hypothetical protein
MLLHNKRQHKTRQQTKIGKSFALFYEYAKKARIRGEGGGGACSFATRPWVSVRVRVRLKVWDMFRFMVMLG